MRQKRSTDYPPRCLISRFLKKKKRERREIAILKDHDDKVIALIENALQGLVSEADLIKIDAIENTLQGYKALVSELQGIDPTFVDSSQDLSAPTGVQPAGFTIPESYSVFKETVLEKTIWLAAIGYVTEAAGNEKGAATVAVPTGAEAATTAFTVGGTTTGGTLAISDGTLVGGGVGGGIGSGGLLSGGVMLCEAASSVLGALGAGGVTGGQIGSIVPVPGVATAIGAGVGLVLGGGLGFFKFRKSVSAAKDSFRKQAAEAREKLLAHFEDSRDTLISTTKITLTADIHNTTSDLDSQISALRERIAEKFKREKREIASLSLAELKNRLARYTECLAQLQD